VPVNDFCSRYRKRHKRKNAYSSRFPIDRRPFLSYFRGLFLTNPMPQSNSAEADENPASPAVNAMKFEAALAELEQIVQNMEAGRLPLEESIAAYRRGSELLRHCQQQLSEAERKIQVLEQGTLRDFDAAGGDAQ